MIQGYYIKATGLPQVVGLPQLKTRNLTVYATGDDADTRRGRDVDDNTIDYVNPFGTTDRFTGVAGVSITNNIYIDWVTYDGSTVFGYHLGSVFSSNRTWQGQIDFCNSLSVGGYSGWSLININELFHLFRYGDGANGSILGTGSQNIWTSTSLSSTTAFYRNTSGNMSSNDKIASYRGIAVRYFNVNGTILI